MKEVSVIIPCWNRKGFLTRAVMSVMQQRYKERIEIIVIDDCSTDGTREELQGLATKYMQVVPIYLDKKLGAPGLVRNVGLLRAKHDTIAYLDSDDIWLPHHLLTAQAYLKGGVSMVSNYWGFAAFKPDTTLIKFIQTEHGPEVVNTNCRVHTRDCLELGYFSDKRWGEDYDFFKRIEDNRKTVRTNVLSSINGYIQGGNNITYEMCENALDNYL